MDQLLLHRGDGACNRITYSWTHSHVFFSLPCYNNFMMSSTPWSSLNKLWRDGLSTSSRPVGWFFQRLALSEGWHFLTLSPQNKERWIFQKKSKIIKISRYHCHIWIQHVKCIKISTNRSSIGSVILEIAPRI